MINKAARVTAIVTAIHSLVFSVDRVYIWEEEARVNLP